MEDKELSSIIDKSFTGESSANDTLKKQVYEYLKARKFKNVDDETFVIKIPQQFTQDFEINHIYHLKEGQIEKTGNEIVTGFYNETKGNDFFSQNFLKPQTIKVKRNKSRNTGIKDQPKTKDEISELKKSFKSLKNSVEKLEKENLLIKELLYSDATSFDDSKTIQTIPIDIYLDTNEPQGIFEVYDAVLKFAKSIGFEDSIEFEAVKGSWYKRILAKSKEKLSSDEVQEKLKEAEYGIEVNTILKQQSEIDKNQSESLSNIITSLKDIPNASIRIGGLIVVKLTDEEGSVSLQTRTLSIKELHLLNKKPELLLKPRQILQALASEINNDGLS